MNIDELYASPEQKKYVEEMKVKFLALFNEHILPSAGADKLLQYLTKSDFFTAPASTKYHGSHPGGLVVHSVLVYERLKMLVGMEKAARQDPRVQAISDSSIAKVALLHDLCKVGVYQISTRNVKNEQGVWEKVPYYSFEENLPFGHSEKSVYIITGFIKLTREEAVAVRWHMGAYDASVKGNTFGNDLGIAFEQYPLSLLLHTADQMASHFDETVSK